jgi:PhzF family phenazine biosynthesis protein
VVILDRLVSDNWMSQLAREMNLPETAFVTPTDVDGADYGLRWFTPAVEVDLCGHATLAAAHCLFSDGCSPPIQFATRSGVLTVDQSPDGSLAMDFPTCPAISIPLPDGLSSALGVQVEWVGRGGTSDVLVVLADEQTVRGLTPDIRGLARIDARGVIVTSRADHARPYDFVSRFFGPRVGVDEDPVTGSAHTLLASYWAQILGRPKLRGMQVSARSGLVGVELMGDRVILTGRAVTILDAVLSDAASFDASWSEIPETLPGDQA